MRAIKIGVIAALFGVLAQPLLSAGEGPPISGWMQNFIVFEEPVLAPLVPVATNGQGTRTLEDFRGRLVLVNFWATWCAPCIRELPSLARLSERMGGEEFVVAIVSQDRGGWKRIEPFMKRLKLDFEHSFLDEGLKFSRAMQVRGLPVVSIIDRQGNEVGRLAGGAEWDSPEALALVQYYIDSIDEGPG